MNQRREFAGGNSLSVVYSDCSVARLYEATLRCVSELGFTVIDQKPVVTTVTFRTPGATPAWPGMELTVAISDAMGGARLAIGGDPYSGYRRQAVTYRGVRDVAIIFLDRLKAVLRPSPNPRPRRPRRG